MRVTILLKAIFVLFIFLSHIVTSHEVKSKESNETLYDLDLYYELYLNIDIDVNFNKEQLLHKSSFDLASTNVQYTYYTIVVKYELLEYNIISNKVPNNSVTPFRVV